MSDGQRERIPSSDPRLGRHIEHDPASRAFAVARRATPTKDVRHRRYGARLDQGNVGACTGFAGAHALNVDPVRKARRPAPTMTDADGLRFYSEATRLDEDPASYPPTDTGSSGLAVCKAMKAEGLISSYEWAFGFQAGLGVISSFALMQGSFWTERMFEPDVDGRVVPSGADAGGHEYLWVGVELRSKLHPSQHRSWFLNQWALPWGVNGYFYMTWPEHEALLARDGDLIRPVV